jgi:hypothetical protein
MDRDAMIAARNRFGEAPYRRHGSFLQPDAILFSSPETT